MEKASCDVMVNKRASLADLYNFWPCVTTKLILNNYKIIIWTNVSLHVCEKKKNAEREKGERNWGKKGERDTHTHTHVYIYVCIYKLRFHILHFL